MNLWRKIRQLWLWSLPEPKLVHGVIRVVFTIPFDRAVVCENCHSISEMRKSTCPLCGSGQLWTLSRVLDLHNVFKSVGK